MSGDSLGHELPRECARVRGLMQRYQEIQTLCGPQVMCGPAIAMMEQALQRADQAMIAGDVVAMIQVYQELQEFEE